MEIRRIDPADDAAVAGWHAAWTAGLAAGRENPPVWALGEVSVPLRDNDPDRSFQHEAYAAVDDGATVGGAMLELPRKDNLSLAEIELAVPVEQRGKGIGSALFDRLLDRASQLGRTSLLSKINQPIGAGQVPGVAFATNRGFTKRNVEMMRILDLPVASERIQKLIDEAEPHMDGYRIEVWQGRCPEKFAAQLAQLKAQLMTDAPTGDMDYEPEVWDVPRLRAEETAVANQDRIIVTAVAVAPDGALAGHTQIAVPGKDKNNTFQWDTLVLIEHRGHRLGQALKAINLRYLQENFTDRTHNLTWNAQQNTFMNAVNDELGFRTVEHLEEWQRS